MDFHGSFFPDLTNFNNLVLASSIFLFYAGMEMGGIHVKEVDNPSKNYPKAVLIGSLVTVLIFVLGTFSLGIIIPKEDINLTQSLLVGFDRYFAFIGMNHAYDMTLASNRLYTLVVVLGIYWLATFISLKGMSWVGKVSKVGGLVGTIIPAGLLVVLAIVYLVAGGTPHMDFHGSFFPDLTNFNNLVLASSIFLFYAGMEMGGIHVKEAGD